MSLSGPASSDEGTESESDRASSRKQIGGLSLWRALLRNELSRLGWDDDDRSRVSGTVARHRWIEHCINFSLFQHNGFLASGHDDNEQRPGSTAFIAFDYSRHQVRRERGAGRSHASQRGKSRAPI